MLRGSEEIKQSTNIFFNRSPFHFNRTDTSFERSVISGNKIFTRLRGVVVLIGGAGLSPRRLWLSFQMPAGIGKLTCARRAFWRSKPRRERVSLGLSAHLAVQSIPANADLNCAHMALREGYMARCVWVESW